MREKENRQLFGESKIGLGNMEDIHNRGLSSYTVTIIQKKKKKYREVFSIFWNRKRWMEHDTIIQRNRSTILHLPSS